MKRVFFLVAVWLIAVNLFGLIALNRLNVSPDTAYPWIDPVKTKQVQSWNFLNLHARWDSNWYWSIAEGGYNYQGADKLSNVVFFPLYPILTRYLSVLTAGNFLFAAWFLSVAGLFAAALFLYKLVKKFEPEADPVQAVMFLVILPAQEGGASSPAKT